MQTAVPLLPVAFLAFLYFLTLWWLDQRAKGRSHGVGMLVIFAVLAVLCISFSVQLLPPLAKEWLNTRPVASVIDGIVVAGAIAYSGNSWVKYYRNKSRSKTATFVGVVTFGVAALLAVFGLIGLILYFTGAQI